jgi:hypothetical protein
MVIDADKRNVNGQPTTGVYYSLSKDLINWDPVKLLMKAPLAWDRPCPSTDNGIRVPALLDPNSTDRNFNTVGQTADLYFVESHFNDNPPDCVETLDRDLVRIPIRFTAKPEGDRLATLEGPAIVDPTTGFDSSSSGSGGMILQDSSYHYDGAKAAWLRSSGTFAGPWGGFTTSAPGATGWPNGTDVWYGAAFRLDLGFKVKVPRVMLMRWLNSASDTSPPPTRYGGILMKPDDSFQLVRGGTGVSEDGLGASFSLPEGRWFWLEVHQKLESDATKGPLSEVFVDGKPVAKSGALNAYPDSDGVPIRAHFGYAQRTSGGSFTEMRLDRASTSTMQRGPLGAPATPTGLTGSESMASITLTWNASSDLAGGGYRVYKQSLLDGTWDQVQQTSSPGYTEMGLAPCSRPRYRVSAYSGSAIGEESPQSEEIEMRPQPGMGCP